MLLNELFTKPLPYEVEGDDSETYYVTFYDPDGNKYVFGSEQKSRVPDYDSWDVDFYAVNEEGWMNDEIIGNRKSLPILSTVAELVLNVIEKKHPDEITFVAKKSEKSRVSLYRQLAKRLANHLHWKVREIPESALIHFVILKPEFDRTFSR